MDFVTNPCHDRHPPLVLWSSQMEGKIKTKQKNKREVSVDISSSMYKNLRRTKVSPNSLYKKMVGALSEIKFYSMWQFSQVTFELKADHFKTS